MAQIVKGLEQDGPKLPHQASIHIEPNAATLAHAHGQHTVLKIYLSLQSHDILAGFVLADIILDGAHSRCILKRVGAFINIHVSGGHIDKHERLGAAS